VLSAVAEVRRATGYKVIALAAAGETAQRFGREVGAHHAMTVDGFLNRVQQGRVHVTLKTAVLIDEAGLLEDWRWAAVMRAVADGAVTVAGDPRQLSPIEAGGLYPLMTKELGAATLRENFRARDEWAKDAWNDLREGKALQAVARLERKRRITISLTRAQSREAAVDQWDKDRRDGAVRGRGVEQYLLLTDTSNTDVDLLNAAAQDRRVQAGDVGGRCIEVVAPRDDGGVRRERFHVGDRVSFTRQVYFGPGRPRVENGATGIVTRIHDDADALDVQLPDRTVTIHTRDLPALRLGYAQHVYAAQGRTVDRIYGVTGGWQTARETSYVGVSRAREASFVYSDFSSLDMDTHNRKSALRELVARASESRAKVSALGWAQHQAEVRERRRAELAALERTRAGRRVDTVKAGEGSGRGADDAARQAAVRELAARREAQDQRRAWENQRE
jgi:ATP-dependent exoDNAse (exonuclease V) alpha subunit